MISPVPKLEKRFESISAAIRQLPEGATLSFEDVSWNEYEELLGILGNDCSSRITFNSGRLEIMSPSDWHDYYKSLLGRLVDVITEELDLDCVAFGSMTLKLEKKRKGTEPDDCFYITNADKVIGKKGLDMKSSPPPDLAIEVDVSHRSDSKFEVYAALGVPEIWRYRKGKMHFYQLSDESYVETTTSGLFPFLTTDVLSGFLKEDYIQNLNQVKRAFRQWVRDNKPE